MKKFFITLLLLFMALPSFAIEWTALTSPLGKTVYLDKESILEKDGYYFYNIKFKKENSSDFQIVTIQSNKKTPFSARINFYTPKQYDELNGDYSNIANNMTKNLEPVTYQSIVNTCYKAVKDIIASKNSLNITF